MSEELKGIGKKRNLMHRPTKLKFGILGIDFHLPADQSILGFLRNYEGAIPKDYPKNSRDLYRGIINGEFDSFIPSAGLKEGKNILEGGYVRHRWILELNEGTLEFYSLAFSDNPTINYLITGRSYSEGLSYHQVMTEGLGEKNIFRGYTSYRMYRKNDLPSNFVRTGTIEIAADPLPRDVLSEAFGEKRLLEFYQNVWPNAKSIAFRGLRKRR